MKRAALVGSAAWAAPAVITLDAAAAQGSNSTPVQVGGQNQVNTGGGSNGVGTGVLGKSATNSPAATATTQVRGTQLARTGVDTKLMVAGGAAAVTAGAAMQLWSADLEGRAAVQEPSSE